jgi:hypothetical protein
MAFRTNVVTRVNSGGNSYSIYLIDNPTIDDVMVVEMRLYAVEVESGITVDRRVNRDVRDLLIRLGVER